MQLEGSGYANYSTAGVWMPGGGKTIQVETSSGAGTHGEYRITFADGQRAEFVPLQFHVHAPSEHTVDGEHYDMEMHLVHKYKRDDDTLELGAVLGIFFVADDTAGENAFLRSLEVSQLSGSSNGSSNTAREVSNVDLADFLDGLDFTHYY